MSWTDPLNLIKRTRLWLKAPNEAPPASFTPLLSASSVKQKEKKACYSNTNKRIHLSHERSHFLASPTLATHNLHFSSWSGTAAAFCFPSACGGAADGVYCPIWLKSSLRFIKYKELYRSTSGRFKWKKKCFYRMLSCNLLSFTRQFSPPSKMFGWYFQILVRNKAFIMELTQPYASECEFGLLLECC